MMISGKNGLHEWKENNNDQRPWRISSMTVLCNDSC